MRSTAEKLDEVADVPGGINVKYILRGAKTLRLIVNLAPNGNNHRVARVSGAHIGDLPVTLELKVIHFSGMADAKFLELARALKELTDAGPNTKWVVDGKLLILVIDLSEGPKMSREHAPGQKFEFASIKANSQLGPSDFRVQMKLHSVGGEPWPLLLSPRGLASVADDASSASIVARRLEYSPSVSVPRLVDSHEMHTGMVELDECITLDFLNLPLLRLRLNVDGKDGQVVGFTGDILSGIGISLKVQIYRETDSPVLSRRAGKRENINAYKEETSTGKNLLVVEFDSSKGNLDPDGKPRRNISNATHLVVNKRYVVDFTATAPTEILPTFPEVYQSVLNYLSLTKNPLLTLSMPAVREAVGSDFPRCNMSRALKNLVWEAVRWYVLQEYIHQERLENEIFPVTIGVV
ncbi:hypothetical protein TraAM80_00794 [Trypanosoma rangeli]|uniref:Uncharacterized protein n=1 Tax=Trypanosoma rangeli TaxID=5698 RepID=A0A422P1I8_TRYRA|nr:uncharacterized protein TraAM80_00794 [Trypanosoma rangeli]RNF11602.1 hypothetical protein TraAM80_00794 [Trypanosoma rangeli]|eukprot:RNF11602.1 hypothetical protein TraAM80_00794 [Trypanosoma rangeli]